MLLKYRANRRRRLGRTLKRLLEGPKAGLLRSISRRMMMMMIMINPGLHKRRGDLSVDEELSVC